MKLFQGITGLVLVALLAACAGTNQAEQAAAEAAAEQARQEQMAAERAAELERQERMRAEELARQERIEEVRRAGELARQEAERQLEEEEAQRRAELARQAAEREALARQQQARIQTLQSQIDSNRTTTSNIEAENRLLQDAVRAAENLAAALNDEGQKYSNIDPATGEPVEELSPETLTELNQELERLRRQVEAARSQVQQ